MKIDLSIFHNVFNIFCRQIGMDKTEMFNSLSHKKAAGLKRE